MNRKKLLALGCAVGILALGACFTPPPRIRLNLHGVRRIVVHVTNTSDTHHIDPGVLGPCVAQQINLRLLGRAKAVADGDSRPEDAVMDIAVLKEEFTEAHPGKASQAVQWRLDLTLSTSVKRSDGRILWSQPDHKHTNPIRAPHDTDPWNSPSLEKSLSSGVCQDLANQMIYQ